MRPNVRAYEVAKSSSCSSSSFQFWLLLSKTFIFMFHRLENTKHFFFFFVRLKMLHVFKECVRMSFSICFFPHEQQCLASCLWNNAPMRSIKTSIYIPLSVPVSMALILRLTMYFAWSLDRLSHFVVVESKKHRRNQRNFKASFSFVHSLHEFGYQFSHSIIRLRFEANETKENTMKKKKN